MHEMEDRCWPIFAELIALFTLSRMLHKFVELESEYLTEGSADLTEDYDADIGVAHKIYAAEDRAYICCFAVLRSANYVAHKFSVLQMFLFLEWK